MKRDENTRRRGDAFEQRIHDYFAGEIAADRFWAKKENCRIFSKKGYHSRDRNSDIIFDVAIELYLPGSDDYSAVILIECKDYTGSVPVNDVEEFFAKVQQVNAAGAKAIFATTAAFQRGAREFAATKRIGLIRYFGPDNFKWELKRSPSASARSTSAEGSELANVALSEPGFISTLFDLFLQSTDT
jgi:predicted helicase